MTKIIELKNILNSSSDKLVIYCVLIKKIHRDLFQANKPLAERLIQYDLKKRVFHLEECIFNYIKTLPNNPLICNFDVLFNPAYNIDILRTFINLRKKIKFELLWPGTFKDKSLLYAEYGYKDFHSYDLDEYDLLCVV